MRDVRLGDRIMVAHADGSLGYEEVYLNTHKDSMQSSAPTSSWLWRRADP